MAFDLPSLPYDRDALSPAMSKDTLDYHYGKHHQAYVNNLNGLIEGTEHAGKPLEEIVKTAAQHDDMAGVFNNAAQVWNHTFYWHSMKPGGGGEPHGKVAELIARDFGSYEAFREAFSKSGATQFGSGWAWLVLNPEGKLETRKTPNAETPLTEDGVVPLLTMDVWEHAYYLDFQNARPKYIESWLDNLVNWDFANQNLSDAGQ